MKLESVLKSDRLVSAVTGMTARKFRELAETFARVYGEAASAERKRKNPRRKPGGGRKSFVESSGAKLLFILFYLKCYPTFDLAAVVFGVDKSQCHEWVHRLMPLLEKALGEKLCLPERRIRTAGEFGQKFPEVRDVFVDATERPVQRSKDSAKQKRNYSGKSRRHARKNQIECDENKRIPTVSPARNGKKHDKKINESDGSPVPKGVAKWLDTGYVGTSGNVVIPHKASKNKPLTPEQKQENRLISHFRVRVEHAIAGIKRMNACAHKYRNRRGQDDQFILLAAGIWNFRISVY